MPSSISRLLTVSLLLAGFTGCGPSVKVPVTVPVSGVVQVDGQPVEGAKVLFIPLEKTSNSCVGTTDATGKYELSQASFRGATPGRYKVTVELYKQTDGKPIPDEMKNDPMQLVAMGRAKQFLPRKYSDPAATELTGEVEEAATTLDFSLVTK
jgi:hypothetical protein